MKLVHKDGTVPSIFFPAGLPKHGGSCHFTTKTCLGKCWATDPNTLEKAILKEFRTVPADELANRIHMELLDIGTLFLQWFAYGDCPPKLTEKIAWIIEYLKAKNVTQLGFTRNKKLWKKVRGLIPMALTVENEQEAKDLSSSYYQGVTDRKYYNNYLTAWPDYNNSETHLYWGIEMVKVGDEMVEKVIGGGNCGGGWYKNVKQNVTEAQPNEIFESDCLLCSRDKRGCFARAIQRRCPR